MRFILVIGAALITKGVSQSEIFNRVKVAAPLWRQQILGLGFSNYLSGQTSTEHVGFEGATYNPVTRTLTTDNFKPNHYQSAPYVANGYFGQSLPAEGVGYCIERSLLASEGSWELNGWPLWQPRETFGTVAGFWNVQNNIANTDGNSVISGIPDWTGLVVTTKEGKSYMPGVDESTVKRYQQSMSVQNGIVHTNVTWQPDDVDNTTFQINFTILAHRTRINLGLVRLDLSVNQACNLTITDILDGAGATRSTFHRKGSKRADSMIWTSVRPCGIQNTTAYVSSTVKIISEKGTELEDIGTHCTRASECPWVSMNQSTVSQSWAVSLNRPQEISICKYVGISSSDAFLHDAQSISWSTALDSSQTPWLELVREHTDAWDEIWQDADIEVRGSEELQITARASLFHLLANSRPGIEGPGVSDNSIMVGGLSSDSYGGLIFWDSDVWMQPSLLLLHPEYAMSINNFRTRMLPQAVKNAQSNNYSGLLFPWTSGRFGNCTLIGSCIGYQYHLNDDVAQAHWHYYLHTKDEAWLKEKGWPIIGNVAHMFANYVIENEKTGKFETKLLSEPDEFAYNIDNGAYTNVGIKLLLGEWAPGAANVLGIATPANWSLISEKMEIPHSEHDDLILEYEGMDGTIVTKQASVVLINYPMGFQANEKQTQNGLAFYAATNSPDGPAMTWAMFAVSEAQLQEQGCAAYTYLLRAYQPYMRAPYYQFSEQVSDDWQTNGGTHPAFPFLTGYGGYLQVFTHGFTGMRPQLDALFLDPVMPPQIPEGMRVKGLKYQGAIFDIHIGLGNTTINRRENKDGRNNPHKPVTVRIGGKASEPGDYILDIGDSLVIPTRRPDLNGTAIEGNLAQCQPVTSEQAHVPGLLPLATVDGSNATLWQPRSAEPASIVIDLGHETSIHGVSINWGPSPPTAFSISGSLVAKVKPFIEIFKTKVIEISQPYKMQEAKLVKVRQGNETVVEFGRRYRVRYVRLTVEGTQGNDKSVGATVAEIAVV